MTVVKRHTPAVLPPGKSLVPSMKFVNMSVLFALRPSLC